MTVKKVDIDCTDLRRNEENNALDCTNIHEKFHKNLFWVLYGTFISIMLMHVQSRLQALVRGMVLISIHYTIMLFSS